ncbi:FAD-dependent pyridine nucleotide-disulfide oxidoreductase [Hymenobacter amundsenii]|uniref:FAD-dependent pyridine nucleotide-disulfide oxidoreductase n=1 Tax=Hymenobacter amundsenii TaxID=2006685 RepID=A0A246FM75_9BACT|nr:NAD(P)/FAD-dependent oxidoreductase [Hymenobacter amundsenii]OWP63789.1 FAD-dependent pyridine nucleotide-disulfide oxidoreductase [Hymenobacter amundsenii]
MPPRPRLTARIPTDVDVAIIGAGSAGLSAALVLGRCLRRVLVLDGGPPRNAPSPAVQAFLTRDGVRPQKLLELGRAELATYQSVEIKAARVVALTRCGKHFELTLEGETGRRSTRTARKVLLATGVEDELPPLPGMRELWGRGVLHCPYCHGWEHRDQPLAVYGPAKLATGLALLVSRWSTDVVMCVEDPAHLSQHARRRLRRQGITVREEPVARLEGTAAGELRHIVFESGEQLARTAVFIHAHQHQRSPLAQELGCRLTSKGAIWVSKQQQTTVPGLYAAGDNTPGTQQALLAAAEGSAAAICINETLTREECPK